LPSLLSLSPFILGFCRSQGYAGGDPRNLHPAFKELAELTSGQAILLKDHWELETLDGLTGGVLEGTNVISMGSNMSSRKKRSLGVGGVADSQYNIPVDESIEKLLVTVSTTKLDTQGWYSPPPPPPPHGQYIDPKSLSFSRFDQTFGMVFDNFGLKWFLQSSLKW